MSQDKDHKTMETLLSVNYLFLFKRTGSSKRQINFGHTPNANGSGEHTSVIDALTARSTA